MSTDPEVKGDPHARDAHAVASDATDLPSSVAKRHEQMMVLEQAVETLAQADVDHPTLAGESAPLRSGSVARGGAGRAGGMVLSSHRKDHLKHAGAGKGGMPTGPITPVMVAASLHKMLNHLGLRMIDLMDSTIDADQRKDVRAELLLLLRLRCVLNRQLQVLPNDVVLCDMVLSYVQQVQKTVNDLQQGGVVRLGVLVTYLRELVNELAVAGAFEKSAQVAFKTRLRELSSQLTEEDADVEALTSQILGVAELTQALWEKHCMVARGSWLEDAVRQRST